MMRVLMMLPLLTLANCATIIEGTSQEITVNTTPAGATCRFDRGGMLLGTVNSTPGSLRVEKKPPGDIAITCDKPGYAGTVRNNKMDLAGATFGNIIAGGLVGVLVDSATGANLKYDSKVDITLVPAQVPVIQPGPPQS